MTSSRHVIHPPSRSRTADHEMRCRSQEATVQSKRRFGNRRSEGSVPYAAIVEEMQWPRLCQVNMYACHHRNHHHRTPVSRTIATVRPGSARSSCTPRLCQVTCTPASRTIAIIIAIATVVPNMVMRVMMLWTKIMKTVVDRSMENDKKLIDQSMNQRMAIDQWM